MDRHFIVSQIVVGDTCGQDEILKEQYPEQVCRNRLGGAIEVDQELLEHSLIHHPPD
jgi:hypothetical protein